MGDPIFIVAAPLSGGTLLEETLAQASGIVVAHGQLDAIIAASCGDLPRLTAENAMPAVAAAVRDAVGKISGESRLVDASPRNGARVPFLHAIFPAASFIYVYREPRRAIFDIVDQTGASAEDLAKQWNASTAMMLDDLERLPPGSWLVAGYRDLVASPTQAIAQIARFLGLSWSGGEPPRTMIPLDEPPPEVVAKFDVVDAMTRATAQRARDFFAAPPARFAASREKAAEIRNEVQAAVFRSVSTQSFAEVLHALGITLVVSTYQSGRLILVRAESPKQLNTHFRMFRSPMGIAVGKGRLAIGTEREVWDYRNVPAVAAKVEPAGKHDACFMPRKMHVTGDIRIHEIGWIDDELWIVNTRFSALCTLDDQSSFVPRWRPPFITKLAAEDRCHLNGMTIIDNRVRYVTALGLTDAAGGWRENKASGGVLLDVDSGEVVLRGLSMPHSPRRYDNRFFILESGKGNLSTADLQSGRVETVVELPGFTRGLAFAAPFAFVGLSQVRETNVFGGIPLTQRVAERQCGVYIVDLRTGNVVGFLRFEGDVREIFDVQVLHGLRYPDLLEIDSPLVATSFTVPDETLRDFGVAATHPSSSRA
jgi:uncharacterized protein (TIGR03032 family)